MKASKHNLPENTLPDYSDEDILNMHESTKEYITFLYYEAWKQHDNLKKLMQRIMESEL